MEYENEPGREGFSGREDHVMPPPPPPPSRQEPEPEPPVNDDIPPLKPNNWLWQSIVVTILCCVPFPLGIVGIIYATRVDSLYISGRYEDAEKASRKARMWVLIAIAIAVLYWIFSVILFVTGNLPDYLENIIENNASGYNF